MKKLILLSILLIIGCDSSTEPEDCAGVTGGTTVEDCAGVCGGTTTQEVCDECPSLVFDCAGVCDGSAVVGGCDNACGSTLVVDECGVCGGSGKQTTYVEECEEEYVCNNVTTWVQLYGDSYCSSNSCHPYESCSWNGDCYGGGGLIHGCDSNSTCVTAEQQTETVCGYETECENVAVTSCP